MFLHGSRRQNLFEAKEHNGYFYHVNRVDPNDSGKLSLRCKERASKNCCATATMIHGHFILQKEHSHPIDHRTSRKKRFNDALYIAATSSLRTFRVLYDELCERDPDGAAEVPFITAEASMIRWRKILCPPKPRSLEHYAQLLQMEQWQKFTNGGQLQATAVLSDNGSTSIVYGDVDFLRTIAAARLYVDTTFSVCPRWPKILQFLTIMTVIDDTPTPIAWAVMERKTFQAYLSVLRHFSTALAPHIRPETFMTDFETGLAVALQTVYPQAVAHRCFFHYTQALTKRAEREGISPLIQECEDMQIIFRKLMALPLLPAEDIITAFQWIVVNTRPELAIHFGPFFNYIERYWLRTIGPELLSVFGMECRTNNMIEAYHRVLKVRFGDHSRIWQFTESLCRLQTVVRSINASLVLGLAITRATAQRNLVHQQMLRRAWDLYTQGLLDIPRFLACASTLLKAYNAFNIVVQANDVNRFVVANEVNENRSQVFLEENLDEIRIFRRQLADGGEEIIILPGLVFQVCSVCRINPMNTICLPCCHWIACVGCTAKFMTLARAENAVIRCSVCVEVVTAFHNIIIQQQ